MINKSPNSPEYRENPFVALKDLVITWFETGLHRVAALIMALGCFLVALALMTWSIHDPSLTHSVDAPAQNALGAFGASLADLLMQSFGVAAMSLLIPPVVFAWRLYHGEEKPRVTDYIKALALVISATAFAACLPHADGWALPSGHGGLFGDALYDLVLVAGGSALGNFAPLVFGTLFLLLSLYALTRLFRWQEVKKSWKNEEPEDDDAEIDEDDHSFGWISIGAMMHLYFRAKSYFAYSRKCRAERQAKRKQAKESPDWGARDPLMGADHHWDPKFQDKAPKGGFRGLVGSYLDWGKREELAIAQAPAPGAFASHPHDGWGHQDRVDPTWHQPQENRVEPEWNINPAQHVQEIRHENPAFHGREASLGGPEFPHEMMVQQNHGTTQDFQPAPGQQAMAVPHPAQEAYPAPGVHHAQGAHPAQGGYPAHHGHPAQGAHPMPQGYRPMEHSGFENPHAANHPHFADPYQFPARPAHGPGQAQHADPFMQPMGGHYPQPSPVWPEANMGHDPAMSAHGQIDPRLRASFGQAPSAHEPFGHARPMHGEQAQHHMGAGHGNHPMFPQGQGYAQPPVNQDFQHDPFADAYANPYGGDAQHLSHQPGFDNPMNARPMSPSNWEQQPDHGMHAMGHEGSAPVNHYPGEQNHEMGTMPPHGPDYAEPQAELVADKRAGSMRRKASKPKESAEDKFELPGLDFLQVPQDMSSYRLGPEELKVNATELEQVLTDFGVKGDIVKAKPGPVVTLYELEPAPGVKSSRVIGLADDIARSMSAVSARVAVVPGRNAIGVELPNEKRETVVLREMLSDKTYQDSGAKLPLCLGKTIGGEPITADLAKMPHLLIAGTTGSGKSVAINTMILSLIYKLDPEQCRLIMIDPKMLELSVYDEIPHLLTPVVTDPKKAVLALKWTVREMEDRYRKMSKLGVRNIEGYNRRVAEAVKQGKAVVRTVQTGFNQSTGEAVFERQEMKLEPLPFIVVIVDEMADLMMVAGKEIEGAVQRLAQMARAAGIHIVMATQRPSVDVITGTIKANFPTRISFQVTSRIDSRTILGDAGAEQLLGQGDMLYMAGGGRTVRLHGPFVSDEEVERVVTHLKSQRAPDYLTDVTEDDGEEEAGEDALSMVGEPVEAGDLYQQAVAVVQRDKKASTSYIQRRLSVGYNRAASLIERMEKEGVVGPANHAGKREILIEGPPQEQF